MSPATAPRPMAPGRAVTLWGICGALLLAAEPGRAGGVPVEPDTVPGAWFAGVWYERELISSDLLQWSDWSGFRGVVVRDFPGGALGVELFQAERFGVRDRGVILDGYADLWARAYANLRIRAAPEAEVLPRMDLRAELFQAWASGWEVSGSLWWMDFPQRDVEVAGVGVARYVADWYLREVVTLSTLAGESVLSASALARFYLDPPREYLEISGGLGKEVVVLGAGPTVDVRETRFVQLGLQRFLTRTWGMAATVMLNRFEGAPARRGGSLGLMARF